MINLLEHAEWVRALATTLVRDDPDDAMQDLWLAALRSPPDPSRPARPWLARVLENAARKRFRDASTRRAHEAGAAPDEPQASPEALVSRVQMQQLMVELVLGLEEPLRQTLLLRFFEGQSSAEISRATGVPAGTVRWRLKEGLARLRAALDARHQGDRASWVLACAPLLLPPAGPWLTGGAALMEKKVRITLVGVLTVFLGLLGGWSFSVQGSPWQRPTQPPLAPEAEVLIGATPAPPAPLLPTAPVVGLAPVPHAAPVGATVGPSAVAPAVAPQGPGSLTPRQTSGGATDAGVRFALDRSGIQAAIESALPEVRDCYESWLGMQRDLGGRLAVTFTIDTDDGEVGRVTHLALGDGGVGNVAFEGCVLSSLKDLRFEPPLEGPMNVTYPMKFSASDDAVPD